MAVFGSGSRMGGSRGPAFGFRFFCYAVLSVVLMFYDNRGTWLEKARFGLQAAIYPLQLAINSPSAAWSWLKENFATRDALQKEVDALRGELREQQLITMRQAALANENAALRGLNKAFPDVIEKRLVGEVISLETSTLRQRLLVNRGSQSSVYKSQPVVTGDGVLGQVFRFGPYSSEIILITDAEHALPVQVLRSGVRTIALGTGRSTALELPYVPQNYDVKEGDVLVTSGLGQVFPYGLPVGRVTKVTLDPTQPLANIQAVPLAKIDADREVLFIWSRANHPAAPATADVLAVEPPKPAATKPAARKKPAAASPIERAPIDRAPAVTPAATAPAVMPAETTAPVEPQPEGPQPEEPQPSEVQPVQPQPTDNPPPGNGTGTT